jgi:hypothetical protein
MDRWLSGTASLRTASSVACFRDLPLWATNKRGDAVAMRQTDGNVVVYDLHGTPIWATQRGR